jgi:hypothetical protein
MGINLSSGLQMLYDGQQQFIQSGADCFLRVGNFVHEGDYIEVGVSFTPSGIESAETGFVDILIEPPPSNRDVSMHNIGMSGGKLMFGAKVFFISHTFVLAMLDRYPKINGFLNVFREWDGTASVIGLVNDNQLYSIEFISKREISGVPINWIITCNTHEEYLEGESQEIELP